MSLIHTKETTEAVGKGNPLPVTFSLRDDAFSLNKVIADASSAVNIKAATTGKNIYITDVVISVSAAMSVRLQTQVAGPEVALGTLNFPSAGIFTKSFVTPLKVGASTGARLDIWASTSGNISITVCGYVA